MKLKITLLLEDRDNNDTLEYSTVHNIFKQTQINSNTLDILREAATAAIDEFDIMLDEHIEPGEEYGS